MKEKQKFVKDFSNLSKDPAIQKKLEENFHFFKLKSKDEQERSLRRQHKLK